MVELTGPESAPGSMPPIPASTQLLAVAWLRWRIFVNGMFRKRPKSKRQIVGLVFGILLRLIVWPMLALIVVGPVAGSGFLAWRAISEGHPKSLAPLLLGIALLWQFVSVNGLSIAATIQSFDPASLVRFPLRFGRYFVLRSLLGLMTPSTIVGCLALLAAAVGIGVANASLALPALVVMAVYASMNIYLTRMIGAWMERWLANRRFREIFSMLMALFAVSIQFMNLQRTPMRGPGARSSWLINILHSSGSYLYWLPSGFAAQAILLVKHPLAALAQFAGLLASTVLFAAVFAIRLHKQFLGEYLSEGVSRRVQAPSAPRVKAPAPQPAALSAPAAAGGIFSPTVAACLRKEWLILTQQWNAADRLAHAADFRGHLQHEPGIFCLLCKVFSACGDCLCSHRRSQLALQHLWRGRPRRAGVSACAHSYARRGCGQKSDEPGADRYRGGACLDHHLRAGANTRSGFDTNLHRVVDGLYRGHESGHWDTAIDPGAAEICSWADRQPRGGTPTNRTSALLVLAVLFGCMLLQVPVAIASSYFSAPWLGAWIFGPLAVAAVFAYALMLRSAERLILAHRDVLAEELCKA